VPHAATLAPVSLRRRVGWLLLAVVGLFAAGIALSIGFSVQADRQARQRLLELEAEQTRTSVVRLLDYYHHLVGHFAQDPQLVDLMRFGTVEEQESWATGHQRLLPEVLGLALVSVRGEVRGDALSLRVGPQCQRDMQSAGTLSDLRPLLHREIPGAEHFDLVAEVRDGGGEVLGGVFVSLRLARLQQIIDDALHPGHAIALIDAAGNTIAARGEVAGSMQEIRADIPSAGWTLHVRAPVEHFKHGGGMQVVTGLLTLAAVLALLGGSMLRLRRTMLRDVDAIRDALAALARSEPVPAIVPHYAEFEPAAADIHGMALQLQDQRAQLAHLSLTDPLTGLPNRRAFETHFPQTLGLAGRGHPVALVLLDVDHFKGVNDRFGHGVGDQVLLALAQALRAVTRQADLAARLAGDEFAALLTGLDAAGVAGWYQRLAERFQRELDSLGLDLHTGLSAGQTWLDGAVEDSLSHVLARADRALYAAKARGRRQLVQDDASTAE
jgi:diguanylate cyclase (GGDEF)-like protein